MTEGNQNKPTEYSKGKIYAVRNCIDNDIFIGSTTQKLCKRFHDHKKNSQEPNKNSLLYIKMREIGQDKFYIELIENCPCETKEELKRREGELIRETATLNKIVAGRTRREYMNEYKEYFDKYQREYRQENTQYYKEYMHQYSKTYRAKNGERLRTQTKEFKQNNPERYKEQKQRYNENHREEISERAKEKRECPRCGCWIRKAGMNKHQQTPKCRSSQEINTLKSMK